MVWENEELNFDWIVMCHSWTGPDIVSCHQSSYCKMQWFKLFVLVAKKLDLNIDTEVNIDSPQLDTRTQRSLFGEIKYICLITTISELLFSFKMDQISDGFLNSLDRECSLKL